MPKKGSTFGAPPPVEENMEDEDDGLDMEDLEEALVNPYNELPPVVRRRVDALSNLHKQYLQVQKKYQEEVTELERKYNKLYAPILDKRTHIVTGAYEPTDEEAKVVKEEEEEDQTPLREAKPEDAEIKGIPQFWLTVMQNNRLVGDSVQEHDEEALGYLQDVRYAELEGTEQNGFTLTFHFAENPFFTNTTLVKTYFMEEEELFGELLFDHATGCKIDWKPSKNLTVKETKKKVKAKGKNKPARTVTVEEPVDSFFSFFSPPEITEEAAEDLIETLETDFDMGCIFKDKLIPYSYLWYTGEAAEYEDDDFEYGDEGEEDDEEEDDEEEEEDDEETHPHPKKSGGAGRGGNAPQRAGPGHSFAPPPGAKNAPNQPPQPECKQQ